MSTRADQTRVHRYSRMWQVTWPVLVANLAQVLLVVTDTVLLGHYSTQALGAVALAAPVYLVATVVVRGWGTAAQVLVARRHGAGQPSEVARVAGVGLALGVAGGIVTALALVGLAPTVLGLIGGDTGLAAPGTVYLRILALAVPFVAATFTLQGVYTGLGATRVTMTMTLLVNAVNLPLGLLLVFGLRLGVTGAAIATLTGTVVGAGFMAWYGRHRFEDLGLLRRGNLHGWRELAPRLWRIGWPECAMLGLGYGIEVALVALVARLGAVSVAANRLIENVTLFSFIALTACGTGVTVLVGQRLGAGDVEGAAAYRAVGLRLSTLLAAVPLVPVLLAPDAVFGLFTPDPRVVAAATSVILLAVVALVPLVFALNLGGVLRAAGDTRTVLVASVAGDAFLVPLAWLLAIGLGLGLRGLMLAWLAYGLVYLAVSWWRYRGGSWRTSTV
jgi:multidrug resistance protein, MATE family